MVNKPLNLKYVYKRQRYLEKPKSVSESVDFSTCTNERSYRYKLENFFENCRDYKCVLSVLEDLYNSNRFNLLETYTLVTMNEIIPTIDPAYLNECVDLTRNSNIGQVNIDKLVETVKLYKRVDRISKNHKNLSKKFKLEQFTNKAKSDRERCFALCEKVDTYTLSPFIKINIALEEISYLCYSEGIDMTPESMVKNVAEYFLLRDNNTPEDIESYRKAINESKVIPLGSDKEIKYLMNESSSDSQYWLDKLNNWKTDYYKTIHDLTEMAKENIGDLSALSEINSTINDFVRVNNLSYDPKDVFKSIKSYSGKEAYNSMKLIKENNIEDTESLLENLTFIWEAEVSDDIYYADGNKEEVTFSLNDIDSFKMHNLVTDAQNAGEFLANIEKTSAKESPLHIKRIQRDEDVIDKDNIVDHIDSNEHISTSIGSYSYEGSTEEAYSFVESMVSCLNNILYNRDSHAYYVLGENTFDIYLRSKYSVILSESATARKGFNRYEKGMICDLFETSNLLENLVDTPIMAIEDKLHDRDYAATITAEEAGLVYEILSPYLEANDNIFTDFIELCREEANPAYSNIKYTCENVVMDEFDLYENHSERLEFCAKVMGIDEAIIQQAKDKMKNTFNKLNPANKIKKFSKPGSADKKKQPAEEVVKNTDESKLTNKNTKEEDKSAQPKLSMKFGKNDNADDKDSNKKPDKDKKEKPKKKPLSLNDVKLAWQGVKGKLKKLSAKEKEFERDLDMEFNHVCKTIENGLTTDHREEIITGQVNRSLSKSIKILIAWAGVGAGVAAAASSPIATGAAVSAVLGPVAMWAKSKFASKKEKMMIIDEIDIELKVLEREIQRAESEGSTKKYRALLTIQKNLQRRRQEIYYGLGFKGKRIPMQSVKGLERE